jgi:hypothetical protein
MEDGDNGSGTGHLLDSLKDLREAVDLDYKTRKKRKHGRVIAEGDLGRRRRPGASTDTVSANAPSPLQWKQSPYTARKPIGRG